jgi:hypothetical protein
MIPAALTAVLFAGPTLAQNVTAQLAGVIVDETGKPLPGARILYTRSPKLVKAADGKWRDAPDENAVLILDRKRLRWKIPDPSATGRRLQPLHPRPRFLDHL